MKWHVVRRFFVVGAELRHIERFVIIRGDGFLAVLDRFAQRISDAGRHVGAHDHRPAAEIDGRNIFAHTGKPGFGHYHRTVTHRHHGFTNYSFHGKEAKAIFQGGPSPAFYSLIEDRIYRSILYAFPAYWIAWPRR